MQSKCCKNTVIGKILILCQTEFLQRHPVYIRQATEPASIRTMHRIMLGAKNALCIDVRLNIETVIRHFRRGETRFRDPQYLTFARQNIASTG